ncbi:MAG: hypothetical protein ACR2QV_08230 [Gammaproteobacteria bacterium]
MRPRVLCPKAYMNVSESRIEHVRWSGDDDERSFLERLFEKKSTYRSWESSHFGLMKTVASGNTPRGHIYGLRKARLALIQRQALFCLMRDEYLSIHDRQVLMSAFHSGTDYSKAIVLEHARFLRSQSSLLCTEYLGETLMDDGRFNTEIERYTEDYAEFFSLYCHWILAQDRGQEYALQPVIWEMKYKLAQARNELMRMPIAADRRRSRRYM